jgi:hypothetical protein
LPDAFHPDWIGTDPTEDAVAAAFLYHDCDEATLEWALSTRRLLLPRGVYGQRLSLAPEILVDLDCPFGFTHRWRQILGVNVRRA